MSDNDPDRTTVSWTEYALLGLLALLWGSSYLFIGTAVAEIPPLTLIAARVTLAAIVLTAIAWQAGYTFPLGAMWFRVYVQAFFNSFGAWTLLAWGQQYVASGLAGVLNSTAPLFVICIALVSGASNATSGRKLLGVACGFCGVIAIMGPSVLLGLGHQIAAQTAILLGAMLYALAALYGRKFSGFAPVVTAAATMLAASSVLLPAALIVEAPLSLTPSVTALAATAALGLLCTALALVIYFRLIRTLGPLGTASQAYLRAGVAVVLGILFLGEQFSLTVGIGVALAITGVVLINLRPHR